ncbi:uncharacterized protein LOC144658507 isoform X2 [Oculina patagonica]
MLLIAAAQAGDHTAVQKHKYYKRNGGDRATRAHLLWDLILTRNNLRLKRNSKTRPLHMSKSKEVYTVPLKLGLCTDQHPMCSSYALNGLCDWPGLFQDLNNIHQICAFSCGYCKKNMPNGGIDFVGASWNTP